MHQTAVCRESPGSAVKRTSFPSAVSWAWSASLIHGLSWLEVSSVPESRLGAQHAVGYGVETHLPAKHVGVGVPILGLVLPGQLLAGLHRFEQEIGIRIRMEIGDDVRAVAEEADRSAIHLGQPCH